MRAFVCVYTNDCCINRFWILQQHFHREAHPAVGAWRSAGVHKYVSLSVRPPQKFLPGTTAWYCSWNFLICFQYNYKKKKRKKKIIKAVSKQEETQCGILFFPANLSGLFGSCRVGLKKNSSLCLCCCRELFKCVFTPQVTIQQSAWVHSFHS